MKSDDNLLYVDLLTRLSDALQREEWERFRVDYLLFRMHFPEEAKDLCNHLSDTARAQCLDIINEIEIEKEI